MTKWRSVRPPGTTKILGGFVLGATTTAVSVVTALLLWDKEVPELVVALCYGVLFPGALFSLRQARSGVHVSGYGVRVRQVLRTRTVRWVELYAVTSRPDGLRQLRTHRQVLWLEPMRGEPFATPLSCRTRAHRRERETYDNAVELVRAQLTSSRVNRFHEALPDPVEVK
ncbi:hypothetical protein [Allokutzneria oryzae]|uniref:PH domain-containing protein n=1 Tax=Allokutzneria oryzae TaxID=1378989 RepID=A0ABV6ABG8_9PSEU